MKIFDCRCSVVGPIACVADVLIGWFKSEGRSARSGAVIQICCTLILKKKKILTIKILLVNVGYFIHFLVDHSVIFPIKILQIVFSYFISPGMILVE